MDKDQPRMPLRGFHVLCLHTLIEYGNVWHTFGRQESVVESSLIPGH